MSLFVFQHIPTTSPLTARESNQPLRTNGRLLLMAAILVGLSSLAHASTVAVGSCANLPFYNTIQAAVDGVPSGSTIKICPNKYKEQVLITKSLTLTGVSANGMVGVNALGPNNPTVLSPTAGVAVNAHDLFDGSDIAAQIAVVTPTGNPAITVNISNLTVDGSNNLIGGCTPDLVGIYYQNASGTMNHNATRKQELGSGLGGCQGGLGIFVQSGYSTGGTSTVSIVNNSVHDYQKNGITADGSGTVATITGNYVVGQGATTAIAQNGIQVSDGANGNVATNTVTDDVYINPTGGPYYSATGILLYDSGGSSTTSLTVSTNIISNTQGGIVTYGDSFGTADYNVISSNKITTSPAAGPYFLDGIDLCSNNNTAKSNTIFNSSGAGVHIDTTCTESTGSSGQNTSVTSNTINEGCAGVMYGPGAGSSQSGNISYNVLQATFASDSCPVGTGTLEKVNVKLRPQPLRR
jgi:hypothetical protein